MPLRTLDKKVWLTVFGGIFVTAGVVAELWYEHRTNITEGQLQAVNGDVFRILDTEAATQRLRAAELEADNLDMRRVIDLHRHLSSPKNVGILKQLRFSPVPAPSIGGLIKFRVQVVSTPDGEATGVADEIFMVLSSIEWNTGRLAPQTGESSTFRSGIEVWTPNPKLPARTPEEQQWAITVWNMGDGLTKWLRSQGIHFVEHRMPIKEMPPILPLDILRRNSFPSDNMYVLVGNKDIDGELALLKKARLAKGSQK
jgi:hypothetical protein